MGVIGVCVGIADPVFFGAQGEGIVEVDFIDEQVGSSHWFGCSASFELRSQGVWSLTEEGVPVWECLGSVTSSSSSEGVFFIASSSAKSAIEDLQTAVRRSRTWG